MATFLYKLGRFAFRRRHFVALFWVALLTLAGVGAAQAPVAGSASFSIPGTEAQKAFDLLEDRFPGASPDGATARVVFKAPDGEKITAPGNRTAVQKAVKELGTGSEVASVVDPFKVKAVSRDGTTTYAQVSYKVSGMELEDSSRDALEDVAQDTRDEGLTVEVGGDALQEIPETGATEVIGIGVAAVVLVITFGSLIAAGLPLVTALIGVGIGVSGITALANALELDSTTSTLAMMIGLAVGIDYALFIVSRYRAELADGREREDAVGRAVGTAGSAVVFAGLTVVIALVGLAVVDIPILTKMGVAAAGTVAIAVLIALTLIPALIGYVRKRVRPAGAKRRPDGGHKKTRRSAKDGRPDDAPRPGADSGAEDVPRREPKPNLGTRWAGFAIRRPLIVLLIAVLGLGAAAVPVKSLELGLPDDGSQPTSTTQRKAYDLLSEGFGPGFNGPLMVVVDVAPGEQPKAAAGEVAKAVKSLDNVLTVTPPTFNKSGDTAMFNVIPDSKPSSAKTEDLVEDIRDDGGEVQAGGGTDVLVTGSTAMNIDVSQKLNDALAPYLALVVGLAFLLLIVVFRSVLVPLKAALGFLLSVLAALGAVVAVFQWGWLADLLAVEETGPVMSMMPIFMVGVVFGLAMDYEVFLVTRMREAYVHGERPKEAIVTGFRHGARVVTAAAVIMIAVFAGFIGSTDSMVKMIGFGLAVAVLFDAFIVRMAIVPAVLALLGRAAWWLPRWLDRALPNVDVEGDGLRDAAGPAGDGTSGPGAPVPPQPSAPHEEERVPVPAGVAASSYELGAETAHEDRSLAMTGSASMGGEPYDPEGSGVRGTVRNADGSPVPRAAVTLISQRGRQIGRSVAHADGSYVLDAPGPGSYVLIAGADGHQPQASTVAVGDVTLTHDILLTGTSRLTGVVRGSADGQPVAAALVVVTDVRGEVLATGRTGRNGDFTFGELIAGNFTLAVNAPGHRPAARPVEVEGQGVTRVEIELSAGARVHGTVRAVNGPLQDARVSLVDAAGNVVASSTTAEDGAYAFTDLDAGDYTVIAAGYPPVATALHVEGTGVDDFDIELSHPDE
ncbi:putative drug exporter of the RND superfamily [Streptomyces sp. WMMB 714]|nr:putative drug exporter of the RND superfamily [Streptomyces sp. WMMB 714]